MTRLEKIELLAGYWHAHEFLPAGEILAAEISAARIGGRLLLSARVWRHGRWVNLKPGSWRAVAAPVVHPRSRPVQFLFDFPPETAKPEN